MFWRPGTKGERHGLEKDLQNPSFFTYRHLRRGGGGQKTLEILAFFQARPGSRSRGCEKRYKSMCFRCFVPAGAQKPLENVSLFDVGPDGPAAPVFKTPIKR